MKSKKQNKGTNKTKQKKTHNTEEELVVARGEGEWGMDKKGEGD